MRQIFPTAVDAIDPATAYADMPTAAGRPGIRLNMIAFLPMLLHQIAAVPVVGMAALLIILVTLVAHRELPGGFPGPTTVVSIAVTPRRRGLGRYRSPPESLPARANLETVHPLHTLTVVTTTGTRLGQYPAHLYWERFNDGSGESWH